MKSLYTFLIVTTSTLFADSFLDDIELQGSIENSAQYYIQAAEDKHPFNDTLLANLEFAYTMDRLTLKTKIKAQQDFYDFYGESEKNRRSFVRLDELYGTYDFDDDQIFAGKNIRFWGALEVRNITDSFNPQDLRSDIFTTDKLGVWNVAYSHYTETGELSLIAKLYEESRKMPAYPYVYYYFPKTISTLLLDLPLVYDEKLHTEKSAYRPSIYLKYSGSTESEYPLDYAIMFENGYDTLRYYTTASSSVFSKITSNENAFLVNKLSTFNTLVLGATLLKLEAVYTDVIDDKEISDSYHLGFGVEHTLAQFLGDADLGLISEYYYYDTLEKEKRSDIELFETFQNDLFVGLRYSFNDANSASLIGGAIVDMEYSEEVYYFEYETRFADALKINFDYRYIHPSQKDKTAFYLMGAHERVNLKIAYYF